MTDLHIGTYEKNGGAGLVPLTIDGDALATSEPRPGALNGSFGTVAGDLAYLVDESEAGAVNILARGGEWRRIARVPSGGSMPCYLALDPARERLAVANYQSGTASLFELDHSGVPQGPPDLFHSSGSGPNEERQDGPHAHCVRFDPTGRTLYLVDLGTDRVLRFDVSDGRFGEPDTAWHAPPGSGPRHLLLHPTQPLALVLAELSSTLTVLDTGGSMWRARTTSSTLPSGWNGESLGGHLALSADGTRVYVSNRGHDSIAVFTLGDGGELGEARHYPSGGSHPRHFVLLEDAARIVVTHEKDGRVTLLGMEDGFPGSSQSAVTVPGACFVLA